MKNYLIILCAVCFLVTGSMLSSCSKDNSEEPSIQPPATENAPDFELNSVDGATVSLSDFKGKPLVIFFFGDTCPLCIASGPKIESKINDRFSENEIAIIGIDTWDGNAASVKSFRASTGVTFDLLLKGSSVLSDYGTTYDRLYVIDAQGNIAFKGKSSASQDIENVVTTIEGLLK